MEAGSDRTFGGTLLRGVLHLPVALTPATARPPLTVAYGPEEVPPWDWTRGRSPWSYLPLGPEGATAGIPGLLGSRYDPQTSTRLNFRLSAPTLLVGHYLGDEPFGPGVERSYLDLLLAFFLTVYPKGKGANRCPH